MDALKWIGAVTFQPLIAQLNFKPHMKAKGCLLYGRGRPVEQAITIIKVQLSRKEVHK